MSWKVTVSWNDEKCSYLRFAQHPEDNWSCRRRFHTPPLDFLWIWNIRDVTLVNFGETLKGTGTYFQRGGATKSRDTNAGLAPTFLFTTKHQKLFFPEPAHVDSLTKHNSKWKKDLIECFRSSGASHGPWFHLRSCHTILWPNVKSYKPKEKWQTSV